jgi:hypothetical protein
MEMKDENAFKNLQLGLRVPITLGAGMSAFIVLCCFT